MVGLPARGKTYISKKLSRYLNWIGINTRGKESSRSDVFKFGMSGDIISVYSMFILNGADRFYIKTNLLINDCYNTKQDKKDILSFFHQNKIYCFLEIYQLFIF